MTTNTNTTTQKTISSVYDSTSTINQESQTEGSLKGRRVINTSEKINTIKAECEWKAAIIGSLPYRTVIAATYAAGVLSSFAFAGRLDLVLCLGFPTLATASNLYDLYTKYTNEISMRENLSNEEFINWAESKEVELTHSNTNEHFNKFNEIVESAKKIERLQIGVLA